MVDVSEASKKYLDESTYPTMVSEIFCHMQGLECAIFHLVLCVNRAVVLHLLFLRSRR